MTRSETPTTTPVGPVFFDDGTLALGAPLDPSTAAALAPAAAAVYAVAFAVLGGDPACGPGTFSLTQVVLAASAAPGGAASAVAVVTLYAADPATGVPGAPIAVRTVFSVSLPPASAPAFVKLDLSGLVVNVPARGSSFALALSFNVPLVLYSAEVGTAPRAAGLAAAYAALLSANGGDSWAPYPAASDAAVLLHGTVLMCEGTRSGTATASSSGTRTRSGTSTCSGTGTVTASLTATRTASQTRSASVTQSRSQSGTRTRSGSATRSGAGSPSPSGSASQSNTPSVTPSASATGSETPSGSATPSESATTSATPSQTPSRTQSPSPTGFPAQIVVDSSEGLGAPLSADAAAARVLAPDTKWAVAVTFPEADPACGPGAYRLTSLVLPLALPDGGEAPASFVAQLYALGSSGAPTTPLRTAVLRAPSALLPAAAPAFYSLALPASFVVNASTPAQASVALSFYASAATLWSAAAGVAQALLPGFAEPLGAFSSVDGGLSWTPAATLGMLQVRPDGAGSG